MTRNLYALLVGINKYDEQSHIPELKGCLNDIQGMQTYLDSRIDKNEFGLRLQILTNDQATRRGIIDGFRQHLAQATAEDIVLFYYAGYGSKATAPKDFWPVTQLTPHSRQLETLVCYDSRMDDAHWDLARIELDQLIAEVTQNGTHITAILDSSCASPTASRSTGNPTAARSLAPDQRLRSIDSFIVSPEVARNRALQNQALQNQALQNQALQNQALQSRNRKHALAPTRANIPRQNTLPKTVTLSAASGLSSAHEYFGAAQPKGAFSHFLQQSLAQTNGPLSCLDLLRRTQALLLSSLPSQQPDIQASPGAGSASLDQPLDQPFLMGAIAPYPPYFTVSHHPEDGWIIDGGIAHGLSAPLSQASRETTQLALFPYYTQPDQMEHVAEAIAQANITGVYARFSKIESAGLKAAKATDIFKAVVTKTSLPLCKVRVEGDTAGVKLLTEAIATASLKQQPAQDVQPLVHYVHYVQLVSASEGAAIKVRASEGAYQIMPPECDRPWMPPICGYSNQNADTIVKALEHIARWKTIVELANPANSQIQGTVKLKIYTGAEPDKEAATEITDAQIRLTYQPAESALTDSKSAGQPAPSWTPERFRIKLHNTSNQPLYCALFYINDRFRAASIKPDSEHSIVQLQPNQEMWFADGAALNSSVPDSLWQQGITECQESLKLIACTHPFDPLLLNLSELEINQSTNQPTGDAKPPGSQAATQPPQGGSLNRLMYQVHSRNPITTEPAAAYDDWITNQITFTFVRPLLPVALSNQTQNRNSTVIGTNRSAVSQNEASWIVKAHPHPQLQANAQLVTVAQAMLGLSHSNTRNADELPLPPGQMAPFQFTSGRTSDAGLSVLALSEIKAVDTVTAEQPLRIETNVSLGEGQQLLPVAFNGESYVPLGYGTTQNGTTQNGTTQIVISRLLRADRAPSAELVTQRSGHVALAPIYIFFRQLDQSTQSANTVESLSLTRNLKNRNPKNQQNKPEASITMPPPPPPKQPSRQVPEPIPPNLSLADPMQPEPAPIKPEPERLPVQPDSVQLESVQPEPVQLELVQPEAIQPESVLQSEPIQPESVLQPEPIQPPVQPLPVQSLPVQPLPVQPNNQPIDPSEVYAPARERSPQSTVSPIMAAWVLVTGTLTLIVALAWIQYFQSGLQPAPDPETTTDPKTTIEEPISPPSAPDTDT